jgi:hypothetical protein
MLRDSIEKEFNGPELNCIFLKKVTRTGFGGKSLHDSTF